MIEMEMVSCFTVGILLERVVERVVRESYRTLELWWKLDERMPEVNRAFNKVRSELYEVGLLADGIYLDQIELGVAMLRSLGESGYVFERVSFIPKLVGYQEGMIYLPSDLPSKAYVPGGTLTDTVRHEFGHAWHWLEPEFFEREWFRKAFYSEYDDPDNTPFVLWWDKLARNRKFQADLDKLRSEETRERFVGKHLLSDFVSEYAATRPCEDFAETFMTFLRFRNSLDRFKHRHGVYRKLKAVEKAVKTARKELGL